jgi:hypothetical protein
MTQRFACLIAAILALAAGPDAGLSASVRHQAADVEILVNGVPVPRYPHAGRWYVEALKGREYAIRLRNPYGVRVAVALSVDGLNTIDARRTSARDARKWVLGPYETITISGWQTSLSHARQFFFTTEDDSYASRLGKPADLGIISAVFFAEKVRRPVPVAGREAPAPAEAGQAGAAKPQSRNERSGVGASAAAKEAEDYAATGMGRETDHRVRQIYMDLEDAPAASIDIRYEYRPQLVRLGILPPVQADLDPLTRRQGARGFAPGFCPIPK